MVYKLSDLPYDYDALEPYIDGETMRIHHGKHHAAYVKNLNDALAGYEELRNLTVEEILSNLNLVPEEVRVKVKNSGGGHANHALFWTVMGPNAGGEPQGKLLQKIAEDFGGFQSFKDKFSQVGLNRFGSGWVWLTADNGRLSIVDTINQDSPLPAGKAPLLTLDVWEHAYYLKYQNRRADYIAAWWNVVNWEEVERRFAGSHW